MTDFDYDCFNDYENETDAQIITDRLIREERQNKQAARNELFFVDMDDCIVASEDDAMLDGEWDEIHDDDLDLDAMWDWYANQRPIA